MEKQYNIQPGSAPHAGVDEIRGFAVDDAGNIVSSPFAGAMINLERTTGRF